MTTPTLLQVIAPIIAATLAALIAVWGGSIAYARQKKIERKSKLLSTRQALYLEFVSDVHDFISATEKAENANEINRLTKELTNKTIKILLIATDNVAHQAGIFRRMLANAIEATGDEKIDAFSKMLLAMREDCFQASKLTATELTVLVPLQGNSEREFFRLQDAERSEN